MKKIILASKSPRRRELMKVLDVEFDVISADIDEKLEKDLPIEQALMQLSNKKAQAIFKCHPNCIVIGADSIVYQNETVFNKPKNKEDAFSMIKAFSNNHHEVMTAVTIISKDHTSNFVSKCKVYFNYLSDEEIYDYLKKDEYKDKAGSYAIQGNMAKFIYKVEGDYYSVVGFPVSKIYHALKEEFDVYK